MAEDSTNAQKGLFAPIAAVTTPDAATVVITLKQPTGNFLFNLGWGDAVIVAPESAAENKNHPVGTGPFVFERWVKGDRIELLRNPDYWGKPARLAKATIKVRSEEHTSELQSLMRSSYAVFCLKNKNTKIKK